MVKNTKLKPVVKTHRQKYVDSFVNEVAGKEGLKIVSCIGCEEVTDEKIEKQTKMKIAEIRSVLNHLHSYGLVEYKREKNLQTGWFTYTWKLNTNRALQNFVTIKKREYKQYKARLENGDGAQIYKCSKNCGGIEFEKAIEYSFRCPDCKGKLNIVNQEEEMKELEEKIEFLQKISKDYTPDELNKKVTNFINST